MRTITASQLKYMMQCPASIFLEAVNSESKYAIEGSKKHKLLERYLITGDEKGIDFDISKLKELINGPDVSFLNIETRVSSDIAGITIEGTPDLIIDQGQKSKIFVVDHKFGESEGYTPKPENNPQLAFFGRYYWLLSGGYQSNKEIYLAVIKYPPNGKSKLEYCLYNHDEWELKFFKFARNIQIAGAQFEFCTGSHCSSCKCVCPFVTKSFNQLGFDTVTDENAVEVYRKFKEKNAIMSKMRKVLYAYGSKKNIEYIDDDGYKRRFGAHPIETREYDYDKTLAVLQKYFFDSQLICFVGKNFTRVGIDNLLRAHPLQEESKRKFLFELDECYKTETRIDVREELV